MTDCVEIRGFIGASATMVYRHHAILAVQQISWIRNKQVFQHCAACAAALPNNRQAAPESSRHDHTAAAMLIDRSDKTARDGVSQFNA
jgi:hypothetical protein